jgi:starvation-inducible DNA-binding protein
VVGPQLPDLHQLVEEQNNTLNEVVDDTAARMRTLGEPAIGMLAEFTPYTRLKEHPSHYPEAHQLLGNLQGDHETLIRQLRGDAEIYAEAFRGTGTHDFLLRIMLQHEKMAWILRSVIQGTSA